MSQGQGGHYLQDQGLGSKAICKCFNWTEWKNTTVRR